MFLTDSNQYLRSLLLGDYFINVLKDYCFPL